MYKNIIFYDLPGFMLPKHVLTPVLNIVLMISSYPENYNFNLGCNVFTTNY
ncbi:hypothetical protein [Candidatus Palibaumannia cicadellinicola]|uniref:Uncharacterized protein n=1 Tax=Candidatus Palibaumannia cicadellinicola TaxID=186490 RepID=A0A0K2BLS0_9GAMM|nr:hypothetical protein [Candidatus Baumannia cicadellinicola]AKZ66134.1 hypothetical protein AB162_556 [Candidatus Baumannia cicadellinicola]